MPGDDTIGTWTLGQLIRFLQDFLRTNPITAVPNVTAEELDVVTMLKILDQFQVFQVQTAVGATGGASAPPANPAGYVRFLDNTGAVKLIPYYNS